MATLTEEIHQGEAQRAAEEAAAESERDREIAEAEGWVQRDLANVANLEASEQANDEAATDAEESWAASEKAREVAEREAHVRWLESVGRKIEPWRIDRETGEAKTEDNRQDAIRSNIEARNSERARNAAYYVSSREEVEQTMADERAQHEADRAAAIQAAEEQRDRERAEAIQRREAEGKGSKQEQLKEGKEPEVVGQSPQETTEGPRAEGEPEGGLEHGVEAEAASYHGAPWERGKVGKNAVASWSYVRKVIASDLKGTYASLAHHASHKF